MSKKTNLNSLKKVVVITGASSGIGFTTAKYFASKNWVVYGLARRQIKEENINSISCDVTDKNQVKKAIEKIYKKEKQIDVLINNAGFGISGSVENQKLEEIEKMFRVNFLGAVNVTQEVLPIMREQGKGKIINTSSVASIFPIPFQSFYSATKASLDIWAKALRMEIKKQNIQICNLLVGDTKTGFTAVREKNLADKNTIYEQVVERSIAKMEHDEQNGKDPITVAKLMFKLSNKNKLPATKTVGFVYKMLVFLEKILPQSFMLWVVSKMYT